MMINNKEQISALIDGEISEAGARSLLDKIEADPELKSEWQKVCMAHDAMQQGLPQYMELNLSARVSKSLETEPAHDMKSNVARIPSQKKPTMIRNLSMAASFVAVISLAMLWGSDPVDPVNPNSKENLQLANNQLSKPQVFQKSSKSPSKSIVTTEVDQELESLLVNHQAYSGSLVMRGGVMPGIQLIGHSTSVEK